MYKRYLSFHEENFLIQTKSKKQKQKQKQKRNREFHKRYALF